MTLLEFLRSRLDEDEKVAGHGHETWECTLDDEGGRPGALLIARGHYIAWDLPDQMATHLARHDPARVLAEVEAKRKILAEHGPNEYGLCGVCVLYDDDHRSPCPTLRALAAVYADHPDYDPAWRP